MVFRYRALQGREPSWTTSEARLRFPKRYIIVTILLVIAIGLTSSYHGSEHLVPQRWRWRPAMAINHEPLPADRIDAIQRFWAPWAKVIHEAKPSTNVTVKYKVAGTYDRGYRHLLEETSIGRPRSNFGDYTTLSDADIGGLRQAHYVVRKALDRYDQGAQARDAKLFDGRGIVTVAGGKFFGPVLPMVRMLRETGSALPVEIFIPDMSEYEPEICDLLSEYNARCIILSDFFAAESGFELSRYQFKIMAILFSSFRDVVFLDADNIPMVDPNTIIDGKAYGTTGFVSWPDFWAGTDTPFFYHIAGTTDRPDNATFPTNLPSSSAESGQFFIDKHRHMKTLILSAYYNIYGPKCFYVLQSQGAIGEGDKTTFESAAYALGLPFYRVPNPPLHVGRYPGRKAGAKWHHSASLQYMPVYDNVPKGEEPWIGQNPPEDPEPAFLHANWPKLDAGILTSGDEIDLTTDEGKHIRLWGDLDVQMKQLGSDLERKTWEVITDMACRLQKSSGYWSERDMKDVCERCREHSRILFEVT